jgi:hypothetical protein
MFAYMKKNFSCRATNLKISSVFFIFLTIFYSYGQFYFFKTSKRQEFVAFLTAFCVIWISCKFIELFQNRKSNLFPDFSIDLGNPDSNIEVQEKNLCNPASNLEA